MPGPDGAGGGCLERPEGDGSPDTSVFNIERGREGKLEFAHAKDAMVSEPAFDHVDKLVVAVRVGRQQKEARVNQIPKRIVDDSLLNFAVKKLDLHPNSVDYGRPGMKI